MKTLSQQQKPVGFWRALKACLPVIFNPKVRNSSLIPFVAEPEVQTQSSGTQSIQVSCNIEKVECGDGEGWEYCQCFLITPDYTPSGRRSAYSFQFSVQFSSGLPANPQFTLEYQGSGLNYAWNPTTGVLSGSVLGPGPVLLRVCGSAGDLIHNLEVQVTGLIVIANVELEIGAPTFNVVKLLELANQTVKAKIT